MPKDAPPEQLRKLLEAVQAAGASSQAGLRSSGRLDHAWILLILHSGLRTGDVCWLKPGDIDWERAELVALVDSLHCGTLNDCQAETVRVLRPELVSRTWRAAGALALVLRDGATALDQPD